ncbi:VCBS repeat-containing protein [Agriterribacter sp.]|uniref:VCBS repeat-containing protein n=1 Tax=Agriterribacter sp. TaxID=2821509 RepID=UPI002B7D5377|nr:VCBS repeat-containing protein [Agriterribacter sp.]HTN06600.1 VCBS repeat-containing protein [Agriterribacter sp.]
MVLRTFYTAFLLLPAIVSSGQPPLAKKPRQFSLLSSKETGISFNNRIRETEEDNVLNYEYFYNGGGVAVGDINNDGLPDIYFTGNTTEDHLYLNRGNLHFKNITAKAIPFFGTGWKTGVTMADINGDGWLDIYVCYSGKGGPEERRNKLYINNKDLTFSERAKEFGLDLPSYSTQACFFDYDKDGDLDCYLLNHNIRDFKRFDAAFVKAMRDEYAGDKLLRNDGGKYVDVSAAAGIKGNPIGFGLGLGVADINLDGWPDIYVSNDYIEQDYYYINNGDGTFTEQLEAAMNHLSYFSMGNAIADINNDIWPDIFTLDMLPEDNKRQKLLYGPENYENYENMLRNGFNHQLMRNMLQLNNGNGTFSETGQLAGISNTDWSWCPLFADFDNDGWKDLYVTNGYLRDYTNMDFMKFYADQKLKSAKGEAKTAMMDILKQMPSSVPQHYIFANRQASGFQNMVKEWGMDQSLISNGAVYADLDNDGDLEIITNNINNKASIYKNNSAIPGGNNYLQIKLDFNAPANSIGTKVLVYTNGKKQYQEFMPVRGFQSSSYTPLHFGLGNYNIIDSIYIIWPDGSSQVQKNIAANTIVTAKYQKGGQLFNYNNLKPGATLFTAKNAFEGYRHQENTANDFKRQLLLPNMMSYQGPKLAKGDVNGDSMEDLFVCGAAGQPSQLFMQQPGGHFRAASSSVFEQDKLCEDLDAVFFDTDKDGDLDLYVVSGGYDLFEKNDPLLQDRLYINDDKGIFTKATDRLPKEQSSDAVVKPFDLDNDGDLDLFVGGRLIPGNYPLPASSRVLINDGKGYFTDATLEVAPFLKDFGMVTSADILDYNGNGYMDIVIAGEWMPLAILENNKGIFGLKNITTPAGETYGWWNSVVADDLDNDGDIDIIAGNYGTNNQIRPTEKEPATMVYGDFDNNEAIDPLLCYFNKGVSYPFVSRDEALNQLFSLRRKFTTYAAYSDATIAGILTPPQLQKAVTLKAGSFNSIVLENTGSGNFIEHKLPIEAQYAPVYAVIIDDFNKDGKKDLVLGGNMTHNRIKIGRIDANYGTVFLGSGNCQFEYLPQAVSGITIKGEVRDIKKIVAGGETLYLFARNNDSIISYTIKN